MTFPELKTQRLRLGRISVSDSHALFELFSDPKVVQFYDLDVFTELAQAEKLVRLFETRYQASAGIRWGIFLQETQALIGTCGFNSWNEKMQHATLGYDLKSQYWNQGLMTEVLREIISAAFAGKLSCGPLHRIQAETIPGNTPSEKLLTKLGFKIEGLRRECLYIRGEFKDLKCYGLLAPESVLQHDRAANSLSAV